MRRTLREVASEPDKAGFTKGRENFAEIAAVDGTRSCNDFEN